jgi:8-oxo-dGTP pyrophosphatase MutT (NUDIX family)
VRLGESHGEATIRELWEELGIEVSEVGECLFEADDPGSHFRIVFVPVVATGTPVPVEHRRVAWYTKSQLHELPLAPSDKRFVSEVLEAGAE